MNFQDQMLTCELCSQTFIWTVTEQRQLHNQDQELVAPARCTTCRLRDPETGRLLGHVKWFNSEKGYGFISKPDGSEIFFHRSQIVAEELVDLAEGTLVSFDERETAKGVEATEVKVESGG